MTYETSTESDTDHHWAQPLKIQFYFFELFVWLSLESQACAEDRGPVSPSHAMKHLWFELLLEVSPFKLSCFSQSRKLESEKM
mmetsp:Transcript_22480/g.40850  ORF Transcript_22480/g.40850 Transcript_22480/m.40850 type:complete len:83 (-) Transcript_22480:49-297(-)